MRYLDNLFVKLYLFACLFIIQTSEKLVRNHSKKFIDHYSTMTVKSKKMLLPVICFITFGKIIGQSVTDTTRPDPKTFNIVKVPKEIYFDDKNPLKLECTVTGNPAPTHISFFCVSQKLRFDQKKPEKTSNDSLTYTHCIDNNLVAEWAKTDKVTCNCLAWDQNNEGQMSDDIIIKHAILDEEWFKHPTSQKVLKHEEAKLICEPPRGEPKPIVGWEKNSLRLPDNKTKYQYKHLSSVLIVQDFVEDDVGNYSCVAENSLGTFK